MRLTLVISSLASGGAERALVLLSESLVKKGYKVSILTLYRQETYFYQVDKRIKVYALNIDNKSHNFIDAIRNNFYRIKVLRRKLCSLQPDIVISFLTETNILTLLAMKNTGIPVIISEQNNPRLDSSGIIWNKLRTFIYPKANKIVSCSKGVDDYFDWIPENQRAVIYNPLTPIIGDESATDVSGKVDIEKKTLVAMGRLTHQKGFDILLSAFKKISLKYPQWQLVILGEGELREQLENLRDKLGLTNQVSFPGRIKNPFPLLKKSEIFVLSSRYEGFGNVIIEAMACGLPVVSTDCPSGPREIINDGVDGILVTTEDVSALAVGIERLISNPQIASRLTKAAYKTVERFNLERIVKNWEVLMNQVIKKNPQHQDKVYKISQESISPIEKNQYTFTVFTPTYNRAHTLHGVYESLKKQTFKNFEWIIVDDGSTDNTKEIVEQWHKESSFPIRYIWQENQGKHIAFNRGVKEAKGELFLNFDSDNKCVVEALEIFKHHWDLIEDKDSFSAVTALCVNTEGKLIGDKFTSDILDSNAFEIRTKYRVFGEKWGFQKTEILKQFTFPEIPGEKFVPEDLVWNRISLFYQTRFINEELGIYRELGNDSLTKSMTKIRVDSVKATRMYYKEYCQLPVPFLWKIRQLINYIRFSLHYKMKLHHIILDSDYKLLSMVVLPVGYYFYISDNYQFHK